MNNEEYVKNNLSKFDLFYEKVKKEGCDLLKQLMNDSWYEKARPLVQIPWRDSSKPYDLICYPYNWLGDGDLCDNAWDLVNKSIPVLIEKTNKVNALKRKLQSTKNNKDFYQILNSVFELSVLCRFSSLIIDIDRKVKIGSGSNVDAVIKLNDREVILEVSRINKDLVNPNIRAGTMSVAKMMGQVLHKIEDKAGKDIQLALAQCPSILAICPPTRGTTQDTIRWALESKMGLFANVGIVIASYNYNFAGCKWYVNTQANYPFTDTEIEQLRKILWQTEPLIIESDVAVNLRESV